MSDKPKKMRRRKKADPLHEGGMQIAGTALNIFGALPLDIHFLYYLGSLPFVIAFLYFWFDMSQSAYADDRLIVWSLVLPMLFIWMKCWQSVFVNKLNSWIYGLPVPVYNLRGIIRLITFVTIVQPTGFIILPVSMILGFPYMTAGFFYQDILLSGHLYKDGFFASCMDSLRCSKNNYSQAMTLMWLFSPWQMGVSVFLICVIIFINKYFGLALATEGTSNALIGVVIFEICLVACVLSPVAAMLAAGTAGAAFLVPWMLEHLFGIETPLSHGYKSMLSSTSFFAVIYFLVFLVLDPLMKISMIIRRFQYNSRGNGEDILLTLKEFARRARGSAGILIFFISLICATFIPCDLHAEPETAISPSVKEIVSERSGDQRKQLDVALDETLRRSRYTWRMPRQLKKKETDENLPEWYKSLDSFMKKMAEKFQNMLDDFADWLRDLLNKKSDPHKSKASWFFNIGLAEGLFYILLSTILITVLVMLLKWLRSRRQLVTVTRKAAVKVHVDIHDQSVSPDALPPDEWLDLASSLVADGNYRAAMRALFLGVLAKLGETGFVTLRAYKSNYDYRRELEIRARDQMEIIDSFKWLCRLMECTWYGFVPVTEQMWKDYQLKSAGLRRECNPDSEQNAGEGIYE